MKKRPAKKHISSKKKSSSFIFIRYIALTVALFALVFGTKGFLSLSSRVHVLGAQIGPVLLADHGSDDSGGGGSESGGSSGGSGSGSSSGSGGSGSSGGSSDTGSNSGSGSSGSTQSVSADTQVDCVGPDGKHFTTSFHDCQELNNAWHRSNFSFTPLTTSQTTEQENKTEDKTTDQQKKENDVVKNEVGKLEVKTEKGKLKFSLTQNGVKVKIEKEGDNLKVKAEKEDGTEVELETKDTLETLNKELESDNVEIATNDASSLTIKNGDTEAETELPISVDPLTHELTVTTAAGVKTVSVLPDKAVQNTLDNKILSNIESQTSSDNTTSQKATLTEVNSEPVFAVKGINQKRILGLLPIGFAKTAFVSAQTGQVVKIDETLINKILEAISF